MLRGGERRLFAAVRHHHEVHRTVAADGAGLRRSLGAHMGADRVATTPQQPQTVLHHIRTVGRRRRRLADPDER